MPTSPPTPARAVTAEGVKAIDLRPGEQPQQQEVMDASGHDSPDVHMDSRAKRGMASPSGFSSATCKGTAS